MLSKEIHPNIFKIILPLPGKNPGPVNVYLFTGENITLVDTGIYPTAGKLEKALRELHLRFSDIDQLIFTHGHIDHCGAAKKIIDKGGAKARCFAHAQDIVQIEKGMTVSGRTYSRFLRHLGLPAVICLVLPFFFRWNRFLPLISKVDSPLNDGDTLKMGNHLGKIISTPGHTKGSICIYLEKEEILFSGDHILGHITPNALPMLEEHGSLPVRMSQVEYYDSLSKIEALSPSVIYPAHGKTIVESKRVLEMYRRCFAQRQQSIIDILKSGELTVYQIAVKLFPELSKKRFLLDLFLALSEVYTHLQVLEVEKKVFLGNKENVILVKIL